MFLPVRATFVLTSLLPLTVSAKVYFAHLHAEERVQIEHGRYCGAKGLSAPSSVGAVGGQDVVSLRVLSPEVWSH